MTLSLRATPLVRLVDAEPCFYDWAPDRALNPKLAALPDRRGLGVLFMCPIHEDCHVGVAFANPIDGFPPMENTKTWQRDGDTFETLTLSPSIKVLGGEGGCQWHGFIKAGLLQTCGDSR